MNTLDCILTRKSIRSFLPDKVTPEQVQTLLQAGASAPSACNAQPWHFIVMEDEASLAAASKLSPYGGMAAKAPLAILICADLGLEEIPGNWVLDCSNAAMNILLAAHDMGLGGVWVGIYPNEAYMQAGHELVQAPDNVKVHSMIVIGHPAKTPRGHKRHLEGRIHQEKW